MNQKISRKTYYQSLGLYLVAVQKQRQVDVLEAEMNSLLGEENGSHASDAIYDYGNMGTVEEFDEAIRKMLIVVEAAESEQP